MVKIKLAPFITSISKELSVEKSNNGKIFFNKAVHNVPLLKRINVNVAESFCGLTCSLCPPVPTVLYIEQRQTFVMKFFSESY